MQKPNRTMLPLSPFAKGGCRKMSTTVSFVILTEARIQYL